MGGGKEGGGEGGRAMVPPPLPDLLLGAQGTHTMQIKHLIN